MAEHPGSADPIEEAWQIVVERWDDAEAHRQFIHLCNELARMADAGRLYREVAKTDEKRKIEAEKRIQAIVVIATEQLHLMKREPPPNRRAMVVWLGFAVSVALLLTSLFQYLRAR